MTKLERIAAKLSRGWDELRVHEAIALAPGLSVRQRAILHALVAHVSAERTCFLGVRALAELGMHKDTAAGELAALREFGMLATHARRNRAHATTFDLSGLPAALLRLLTVSCAEGHETAPIPAAAVSGTEGHDVSCAEGQPRPEPRDTTESARVPCEPPPCPSGAVAVSLETGFRVLHEGTQGRSEGRSEGIASTPTPDQTQTSKPTESTKRDGWGLAPPGEPEDEQGPKRAARQPRARANGKTPNPHVRTLFDHYTAEHERLRSAHPVFPGKDGGRAAKAFEQILGVTDLETAKAAITRALSDGFHVQPWRIKAELNRYLAASKPRRGTHAPQPSGGRFDAAKVTGPDWLEGAG